MFFVFGVFFLGGGFSWAGVIFFCEEQRGGAPFIFFPPAIPEKVPSTSVKDSSQPAVTVSFPGTEQAVKTNEKCAFVGSKNSNKYHLPSCAFAKRIKPENLVCFTSKEEAEKRGYVAGCLK